MLVGSDTASLDAFPTNVVVYDEPLPRTESGGSAVTEVLVIGHSEHSGGGAHDPLDAALQDLMAPILEVADAEMLEARRVQLVERAKKLANMRCLSEAYQREMDRAVGGTPAPGGPSRIGTVQQCDTPKYTGSVKPEDWLVDYSTAVSIANGNKRVAMKYVPLMLQGTARTWLNSLKPSSINSWVNFTEAFIRNFTSTYKRPPKPRQLSLCVQGPNEPTRDYLTRWTELRNSCEGMHEVQAIECFTAGCREGTLLKHRLLCDEPATLDELLIIADKYATANSSMKAEIQVVDLESPYHALLGRPALAKFMAVPHYAYLKMKMPSSKGILTIAGDYKQSSACAADSSRLTESLVIAAEKRLLDRVVAMAGKQPEMSPNPKESEAEGSFKPAKETKKIPLDPEHPERHTVIGANLDSK
ncbi:uncharacterized protein [Aegilops tauschii subsp. strangulata]|uniref:uncharacterized protein n=1 Tax=Aegilops tauschii subsp. strangulata TaxID=200361 RepID=UPI00098AE16C|nr:uncharacterized protein LOC109740002 [Aegilops tauschii subsp. strangulata]